MALADGVRHYVPDVLNWIQVWGTHDQSIESMPSSCRNCWDTPTTCGLALSYIRRNSVPTTPEYGLTRGLRISSQYLMPMKCTPHHWWATAKRVMLDGVCCRQQNVLHGISRLCHVCRMCSVRTLQASASWGHVTCRTSPHLEQGAPRRAFPFTMIEVTVFGSNEFIKAGRILDRFLTRIDLVETSGMKLWYQTHG